MNKYSFFTILYLLYCKVRGFFVFRNARIIRFPIDIRGKKFMKVKRGMTTGKGCRMEAFSTYKGCCLTIGVNFQMNDYVHITAMESVYIGDNVLIASKVYISDCSHGSYAGDERDSNPLTSPIERPLFSNPVVIKDNVWIGEFVSVLPGVSIGEGSIIGANSVVTRSIPPYVIAVGAPAVPIKKFNFETQNWEKII